jgi:hypothetical protein
MGFLAVLFFIIAFINLLFINLTGVFFFFVVGIVFASVAGHFNRSKHHFNRSKNNLKEDNQHYQNLVETGKAASDIEINSDQHIAWMKEQVAKHEAGQRVVQPPLYMCQCGVGREAHREAPNA